MRVSNLIRGAAILLLLPSVGAAKPVKPARTVIVDKHAELHACIKEGKTAEDVRERATLITNTFVDFDELARLTIQCHWKEINKERRKEFAKLFKGVVQRSYVRHLKPSKKVQIITRAHVEHRSGKRAAFALIRLDDVEVRVEYRLHRPVDKKGWWVYDIIIDDVSLVRNYRSQFQKIIQKRGIKGLLERLREAQK
tara:strand:+ start:299 stop:886 length:588 start_codon:yes stop_codon:yes gene_type:complete